MTRYLIINHMLYGTYQIPVIDKKHVVARAKRECDHIFDTINGTEFDPDKNEWVRVKEKEDYK